MRAWAIRRLLDCFYDALNIVERFFQSLQNMNTLLAARKVKTHSSLHHFKTMLEKFFKHSLERERARLQAIQKRYHVDMERLFKVGMAEKGV